MMNNVPIVLAFSFFTLLFSSCSHHYESDVLDLTTYQWNLWPDTAADWRNDSLFLPPVNISNLPENPPTCGWEELHRGIGKLVRVPATVEEHFQGETGRTYGISGDYTGVSWFHTRFTLPELWENRHILLKFGGARLRVEVYLNEQLVGYDVVNGSAFEVDVTDVIYYVRDNHLAVRITDPGGNPSEDDYSDLTLGNLKSSAGDYHGGITGPVHVVASDSIPVAGPAPATR
jgi:beta-galactosidase